MRDAPSVSVIIPTHQRREALARALRSLSSQTTCDKFEVVVSVDGSSDGTAELLESLVPPYPLRYVTGPRRGRAAACNRALEMARGDVVITLDDDMEVVPEFIACHLRHHVAGSRLCVLGAAPITLSANSPRAARFIQAKFNAHLARLEQPGHVYVARDFYTGNTSVPREVLCEVGGFDESFDVYGNEDVDLWMRLRAARVTFRFDPEALAHQSYMKDLRGLAEDNVAKGRTAVMLVRSHPELFTESALAAPWSHSRPWLCIRAVLLEVTRRRPAAATAVFRLAAALERHGLWRWRLFYQAVLDYGFWAGADRELRGARDLGELGGLASGLRLGPIRVLIGAVPSFRCRA